MAIPSRQIGWNTESNLLWQILKQLQKLTSVLFALKPKYKVFTALVTQSGASTELNKNSGDLTIGITYRIDDNSGGADFTNVGAPSNNVGVFFIATGTIPNSFGTGNLTYDTGAPIVTILENTLGNVWWIYMAEGIYSLNSLNLFIAEKTTFSTGLLNTSNTNGDKLFFSPDSESQYSLYLVDSLNNSVNNIGTNLLVEIRVYN